MALNLYNNFFVTDKNNDICLYLHNQEIFTYKQLDERVAQFCCFLREIGLSSGDRVIQQTSKSLDAFCLYLAVIRYGAIYVPLNPDFQFNETVYFIEDAAPTLFVCDKKLFESISLYLNQKETRCFVCTLTVEGDGSIQTAIKDLPVTFQMTSENNSEIACILYTSGTTGKPKGAMLSHRNLLSNGMALAQLWEIKSSDVLLHTLPIFHCHGLFFACHSLLLAGGKMIFLPKFDVDLVIEHLPHSTIFMGVHTYYSRLLADTRVDRNLTKKIRVFISGSAPLLQKTFFDFERRTGHKILERYGMTETGINTSNPFWGERIPESVGLPLPEVELRITNAEDANIGLNKEGNIQIRGANIFLGYWGKDAQKQDHFTLDDYFRTGDIGIIKENGYVYILDRAKDLIISGGLNVYPKEIEDVINQISGVIESAVVGLQHHDFGETAVAVVVKEKDSNIQPEDIIKEVKQNLANYKVPKKVFFLDALPRNPMGKIQKNILRANLVY